MTGEKVTADFIGRYAKNPETGMTQEPKSARIVMSRKRLVVAADDERLTVPLSDVVDLVVGNVPPDLRDLFDSTVTIGYRNDDDRIETILIEGGDETISKFETVAFRCLLSGTKAKIKHPARVGGRVTDEPVRNAKIAIDPEQVTFRTSGGSFRIDITSVIGFERAERSPDGTSRPSLLIKHASGGAVSTSLIAPLSTRRLNILGRFLRVRYSELLGEAEEIDLDESQKRLLVTIYASGGDIDFGNVLNGDAARATNVLNALSRKGLVSEDGTGISLTSLGQIIVTQRLEDVNI